MGLLDELEQEAAQRSAAEGTDEAAYQARETCWNEQLQPAVVRLGEFLTRLSKSLTAAQRRIRMVHVIAGYGEVVSFGEAPFDCRVTAGQGQYELEFSFVAQASPGDSTLVIADTPGKVRLINGLLQKHHLSGLHDITKNANGEVVSGRFEARGRIPVRLQVAATKESGQIRMNLTNIEAFGTIQRSFTAEALNDDVLDQLGRYLLREVDNFSQEAVGDDIRQHLQEQVKQDQLKREWEARLAVQLRDDEARVMTLMSRPSSPSAWLARVNRLFRRSAR